MLALAGCSSDGNKEASNSTSISSEISLSSSSASSESTSEVSDIKSVSDEEETETDNKELENAETKDYKGLKFECSNEWGYEENDTSATVTFEPQVKFVNIIPTDISTMGETADTWDALAIESMLSGFKSVSDREDYTVTVAGEERKAMKCVIGDMYTPVKYTVISISNKDLGYQFSICYGNAETSENPDDSEFEAFLNSISF